MKLRSYQLQAVRELRGALAQPDCHPVVQLPTGTGKSLIIAELAAQLEKTIILVLTHVQELVRQDVDTFEAHTGERAGVYCAALNRKEPGRRVTYGSVQSVVSALGRIPPPDLIIVDEAHRVPHLSANGAYYRRVFAAFPNARRIGMTATPWRLDNGRIYGETEDFWFNYLCYRYTVQQATADGWLAPLVAVESEVQLDLNDVPVNGDYVQREVNDRETNEWLAAVVRSVQQLAAQRQHIAVYCPGLTSAYRMTNLLHQETEWSVDCVTGDTPAQARRELLARFKRGELRILVSVDILTTGFDYPALDCIVVLRPTVSSSLWVQICGRGTRLAPDKRNCLILDYVGNFARLGGVGMIDTYYRERNGAVAEEREAVPDSEAPQRTPRRLLPGVRTLVPLDPITGQAAGSDAVLLVDVHASSAVALPDRTRAGVHYLMLTHECCTPEGARLTAARFIRPESPPGSTSWAEAERVLRERGAAVRHPVKCRALMGQAKGWRAPTQLRIRKQGRYWTIVEEIYGTERKTQVTTHQTPKGATALDTV